MERKREMAKKVVFLDRDGTLNVDIGYMRNPEELVLIEGAARSVRKLNDLGVFVVVLTNQSGVGRGYFTEAEVGRANERLLELLKKEGARADAVYFCPHHPDDGCSCRKPAIGMLKQAAAEHGLELKGAIVIGDKLTDVELAHNAGGRGVLVLTGFGSDESAKVGETGRAPDFIAKEIGEAVDWAIREMGL